MYPDTERASHEIERKNMQFVNLEKLQYCFDALWAVLADKQAGRYETVSFRHGIIAEQEGFKQNLIEESKSKLLSMPWNEQGIIGSRRIYSVAGELLSMCPHKDASKPQILVDARDVSNFYLANHSQKVLSRIEEALRLLYTGNDDERAFNMLSASLPDRGKYALITYFFFLKDSSKYQVVRPNNFANRFAMIGAPTKCTKVCSWENYQTFLSVLREVKDYLSECLYEEISLTDAHSFVWMLRHIDGVEVNTSDMESACAEKDCTAVYISAKEGRKILYYTGKYERKPELREEAIRIHGYDCAVCGFNFEEHYGIRGKEYIEVHHTKPLSSFDGEMEVHPDTDMVCLCSNCHSMIHRKRNAILTVEDLRKIMASCK